MKGSRMLTAILVSVFISIMASQLQAQPVVNQEVPDFTLMDSMGKKHAVSDFRGSFVVLEWINPDCPFVRKHYDSGNIQSLQKKYTDKGVVWLSVASSAPGKQGYYSADEWNQIVVDKKAHSTAVLLDSQGVVGKKYEARTTPHMFVINPKGILIYQGAIDSINSTNTADISQAENYVQEALDAAMNGKEVKNSSTKSYGCSVKYA